MKEKKVREDKLKNKVIKEPSRDGNLSNMLDPDTKILLSFDGGGIRGYMSMIIIAALEKACGLPLAHCCDLLIGTSIGGINALLLTAPASDNSKEPKYSARELVDDYRGYGRKIFSESLKYSMKSLWGIEKSSYNHVGFKEVAEEFFGDRFISEAIAPVMVTGVEIEKYTPLLMKSYGQADYYMKEAALSTAAAPTYFPPSILKAFSVDHDKNSNTREEKELYVVDGAVAAVNDPALLGYIELCELYNDVKDIKEKIVVISIGTGKTHRTIHYDDIASGGHAAWMPYVMPIIMELTSEVTDYQLRVLLKDLVKSDGGFFRRYWRLQPIIPEEYLALADTSDIKLKGYANIAENYVREHKREIEFLGKLLFLRGQLLKKEKESK